MKNVLLFAVLAGVAGAIAIYLVSLDVLDSNSVDSLDDGDNRNMIHSMG